MDVVCCICQCKTGEKPGEGISHTICTPCTPKYLKKNGFTNQEVKELMKKRERKHEADTDCKLAGKQEP
jgi:hypothetical protein